MREIFTVTILFIALFFWFGPFITNFPLHGKIECNSTVKYKGKKYRNTYYYEIMGWQIFDEQHNTRINVDDRAVKDIKKFSTGEILHWKVVTNPTYQEDIRINTFTRSFKRNQCPMHGCKKDRSNVITHKGRCKKIN